MKQAGGLDRLARETGLKAEVLYGFQLGALLTRLEEIQFLQPYLEESVEALWVQAWEKAIDEVFQGMRVFPKDWGEELVSWRKEQVGLEQKAENLHQILQKHIHSIPQRHVRIERERCIASFRQALQQVQKEGRKISPHRLADLAHGIYGEGLPEEEQPSQGTFRYYVGGSRKKDREIMARIEASGVVEKRKRK